MDAIRAAQKAITAWHREDSRAARNCLEQAVRSQRGDLPRLFDGYKALLDAERE